MTQRNKFKRYKKNIATLQVEVPYLFKNKQSPIVLGIGSFEPLCALTSLSRTVLRDVLSVWCSRLEYHQAMINNSNCAYLETGEDERIHLKWCPIVPSRKMFARDQLQRRVNCNPFLFNRYNLKEYGVLLCEKDTMLPLTSTTVSSAQKVAM